MNLIASIHQHQPKPKAPSLDRLIEHARYVYRYTDLGPVNQAAGDLLHGLLALKAEHAADTESKERAA